jgi:hypothetical protein
MTKHPFTLVPFAAAAYLCACRGDRQTLFDIRAELQKGLSRSAVDAIVETHRTATFYQQVQASGQQEWLRITSADSCILSIGFQEGRLISAELRDEDSIYTPCSGAPEDLK